MTLFRHSPIDRGRIESLVQDGKHKEALAVLDRRLKENPLDLECRLLRLLLSMKIRGPERFEGVIDAIRSLPDVGERENKIVKEILLLGFEAAQKSGQTEKMRAYQRELALRTPLASPTSGVTARPRAIQQNEKPDAESSWVIKLYNAVTGVKSVRGLPRSGLDRATAKNLAVITSAIMLIMPLTYYVFGNGKIPARQMGDAPVLRAAAENMVAITEEPRRGDNPSDPPFQGGGNPTDQSAVALKNGFKDVFNKPVREIRRPIPIREQPRFASAVVQEMDRGAKIVVLEVNGSWLKVQTQEHGKIGFVRKEFTTPHAD